MVKGLSNGDSLRRVEREQSSDEVKELSVDVVRWRDGLLHENVHQGVMT